MEGASVFICLSFCRRFWRCRILCRCLLSGRGASIIYPLPLPFAKACHLQTLSTVETTKDDHIYLPTDGEPEEPLNLRFLPHSTFLTRPLFVALITMACLSFLDASLYATYTLLLGSPIAAGGLDFRPKTIGYILGTAALCHGLVQAFCFPNILKRWGTRTVYAASMTAYIFLYIMMPIMNALARQAGRVTPVVWGLLVLAEVVFFASYSSYGQLK